MLAFMDLKKYMSNDLSVAFLTNFKNSHFSWTCTKNTNDNLAAFENQLSLFFYYSTKVKW